LIFTEKKGKYDKLLIGFTARIEDNQRIIPAIFGLIWFRGFRGEDLNVKVYDVGRTASDDKSSLGLWLCELKKKRSIVTIYTYYN
jgi:hypothetical protein